MLSTLVPVDNVAPDNCNEQFYDKVIWKVKEESENDPASLDAFVATMAEYLMPHYVRWLDSGGVK